MSAGDIIIREAVPEDGAAIARILYNLGWFAHINNEPLSTTQALIEEKIEQCGREGAHTILVAEQAPYGAIGYISVHWLPNLALGYDGYVSELFLRPDVTGQGVGSRLLEAIKTYAKQRGCTRLMLVNMRNRESYQRNFYTKQGWQEVEEAALFKYVL